MSAVVAEQPVADELRDALRRAQVEAAAAGRLASDSADAAARAAAAAETARAELARFDGLDAKVAGFLARAYRSGSPGVAALPPDLTEAKVERARLAEHYADHVAVHELLLGEAGAAKCQHELKVAVALKAADAVVQSEGEQVLRRMLEHEREAARMRQSLCDLMDNRGGDDPPIAWTIGELVHHDRHPLMLALAPSGPRDVDRWRKHRAELLFDSDSEIEV